MTWLAHAFLAATPLEGDGRTVVPLQGFSWGFAVASAEVTLTPPEPLPPDAWVDHLPYLRACYPRWTFAADPVWRG